LFRNYFLAIIWIILSVSIFFLHGQIISRPLIGHHDLANGLVLTVASIWDKEGFFTYNLAPVYSYTSDIPLKEGFGIRGRDGRMYYVSFPPGVYVIFYVLAKLFFLGIKDTSLRILSLAFFIIDCFLLYRYLSSRYGVFSALVGIGAFSFFPTSAYFLGSHFMYESVILPFWFFSFLCFRKLIFSPYNQKYYLCFFILIFILSFCGFFGLFLTAAIFIMVFFFGRRFSWNIKYRILFLFNLTICGFAPFIITYFLYLGKIDQDVLNNQLFHRFLYRTNMDLFYKNSPSFLDTFYKFYEKLSFHAKISFGDYFPAIFFLAFLILVLAIPFKIKLFRKNEIMPYLFFFLVAPFLHYIILSNHLYEHDFAYLFILFFVTFLFVWSFKTLEEIIRKYWKKAWFSLLTAALIYIFIIPATSTGGYRRYFDEWIYDTPDYPIMLTNMRKNSNEHDLIITNYDSNAMMWYYLQRNVLGKMFGDEVINYKNTYPNIKNIYYMTDTKINAQISCGEREIVNKDLLYICKLN